MLSDFKDKLAMDLYGMTVRQAHAEGVCINCRRDPDETTYSEAGTAEYLISGLCEGCFDFITKEQDRH